MLDNHGLPKTFLSWSGGKDACMAFHQCHLQGVTINELVTTVSLPFQRITMHGVARHLLEAQAQALNMPLYIVELPEGVDMATYDKIIKATLNDLHSIGFTQAVYGDIFLQDLKEYREAQFQNSGVDLLFPLWQQDTRTLVESFIDLGYKAVIVAANASLLGKEFLGATLDHQLLANLPDGVDPCGENGEFHTFVYDGPLFNRSLNISPGETVLKKYGANSDRWDNEFWFCELTLNK